MLRRLLWLTLLTTPALAQVVVSHDFETAPNGRPSGWQFSAQRGQCEGAWIDGEPAGGHSLQCRITDDPTARATWVYPGKIEVQPNTPYRVSYRSLLAEVSPTCNVYLILYENGLEDPAHWHRTVFEHGSRDWHTVSLTFRTGPETTWLKAQLKLWYGSGTAFFDDFRLEQLPAGSPVGDEATQRPYPASDGSPLQCYWYPAQRRPDGTVHLVQGQFNPVAFFPWGAKEQVDEPYLVLTLPPEVKVAGPVVSGRLPMPPDVTVKPERVGSLNRWRLPIPKDGLLPVMRPEQPLWTAYHFVYVTPGEGCPREFEWQWQVENGGQLGPEHTVPAKLSPSPAGAARRTDWFPIYAQHTGALRYPTESGRAGVLKWAALAGIEGGLSLTHYQPEYAKIDEELHAAGFNTWGWKFDGWGVGANVPGERCVDRDGQPVPSKLTPYLQAAGDEAWYRSLADYYRRKLATGLQKLIIDYEPNIYQVDFSPGNRAAFAAWAKLAPAKVAALTAQELRELPGSLWGKFTAEQNGAIVKYHLAAIHEIDPQVKVGLCCSSRLPEIAAHGMDIKLFEPEVGFHAPMIYRVGTAYEREIRATCEAVTKPVLPFVLASDLAVPPTFPSPAELRTNLLVTALAGGRGAILWVGLESLDAEYLLAVRDALESIEQLEPYLRGGRRDDLSLLGIEPGGTRQVKVGERAVTVTTNGTEPELRTWVWQSPHGTLAAIANYGAEPKPVVIRGAQGAKSVLGSAPKARAAEAVLTVAAGEVCAVGW